jgi:SAM-dependent methyltransferase
MIQKIVYLLKTEGARGLARAVGHSIAPLLRDRKGLEIGGPSQLFSRRGLFPVYPIIAELDNCNFSPTTIWEGTIVEGRTFHFDPQRAPGRQYIAEAVDLSAIADGAYDFVLASHVLEHSANPIRALNEWLRVLTESGVLVLVLPHKEGSFDHRRPVTTLAHMIEDYERGTTEDDLTHLPEVLTLHALDLWPIEGGPEAFRARSEKNSENRCLHHHVFNSWLALALVTHVGLQVLAAEVRLPYHILVVAQKLPPGKQARNEAFSSAAAEFRRRSPFPGDRNPSLNH